MSARCLITVSVSENSTEVKGKRAWPDKGGGQFLHSGEREKKEKEILRCSNRTNYCAGGRGEIKLI